MSVAFVVWNPFQVFHLRSIVENLPGSFFLVIDWLVDTDLDEAFGGSVADFIDLPHERMSPAGIPKLDGQVEAFVCTNPFPRMRRIVRSKKISMQYSMTKESYQYGAWRAAYDLNLAYGQYTQARLAKYGPVRAVGNPRFDPWFRAGLDREPAAHDPRSILYLPTWGEFSSVDDFGEALAALESDYHVISKLHHKSYLSESASVDSSSKRLLNVTLSAHDDLLEQLERADLIISDYSGAIFDGVYVRKPVVLLQKDPRSLVGPKFTFDSIEYRRNSEIGPVVSDPHDLAETVRSVMEGTVTFRDENEKLRADCFAAEGNCGELAAEAILEFLEHAKVSAPPSPIVDAFTIGTVDIDTKPVAEEAAASVATRAEWPVLRPNATPKSMATAIGGPRWRAKSVLGSKPGRHLLRFGGKTAGLVGGKPIGDRLVMAADRLERHPALAFRRALRVAHRRPMVAGAVVEAAELGLEAGRNDEVAALLSEAVGRGVDDWRVFVLLARVHERADPTAFVWSGALGLVGVGDPERTREWLLRALEFEEAHETVVPALAMNATRRSDRSDAEHWFKLWKEVSPSSSTAWNEHGKYREFDFDLDAALGLYEEALRLDPRSQLLQRQIVRVQCKREHWREVAASLQRFDSGVEERRVRRWLMSTTGRPCFLDVLEPCLSDEALPPAARVGEALHDAAHLAHVRPHLYWEALHWRLIAGGQFSNAYLALDRAAEAVILDYQRLGAPSASQLALVFRAMASLGRVDEVPEVLARSAASAPGILNSRYLAKVVADLGLLQGHRDGFDRWYDERRSWAAVHEPSHLVARHLYEGRSLYIEGPAPVPASRRFTIDDHDVLVKPNVIPESPDSASVRESVIYLNGGFRQLGIEAVEAAAATSSQVVLRRPVPQLSGVRSLEEGRVRFVATEPSMHFRGAPFGVQRILYDALTFRPSRIRVTGVDFFVGADEYVEGHKVHAAADVSFRGFGHDFRGDLRLSRALRDAGIVEFDEHASAVLDLSDDDYLETLDRKAEHGG